MKDYFQFIHPYVYPGLKKVGFRKKYDFLNRVGSPLSKQYILHIVCKECDVTITDVLSPKRNREFVIARSILSVILLKKFTLIEIGELLGNRTHATIINLKRKFNIDYNNDENFKNKTDRIFKLLNITL